MRKRELGESIDAISTLREPTRLRLYRYVERQPAPVSRDQAARAVGVSRALAAFHLDKLVAVGLLRTEYRRLSGRSGRGAGRTSKLYRRSSHHLDVTLPERQFETLSRLLAESLPGDQEVVTQPATEYGRALGTKARSHIRGRPSPERLLTCIADVLDTLGFEPYRDSAGNVRVRNCPFDPLSRIYTPVVCGTAEAMVSGIVEGVGGSGLRVRREMHPHRCCTVVSVDAPIESPAQAGQRS